MKNFKRFVSLSVVLTVTLVMFFAAVSAEAAWKKEGVKITAGKLATYTTENGNSVSDGSNGIIFIHKKNSKYYVQRLNSQADKMWGDDGVFIVKDSSGKKMVADGSGGVFIVFNSGNKAYVQHVNKSGKKKWGIKGKMIYYGGKYAVPDNRIVSDRSGGIFVSSTFSPTGTAGQYVTYVGRVNKKGKILWRKFGDFGNKIISDKKGNVYTIFSDATSSYKLSKLNSAGQILWTSPSMSMYNFYDLVLDKKNGIIVIGARATNKYRLVAWKVDSHGKMKWSERKFSGTNSVVGSTPIIVSDGKGGAIAVWNFSSVYAQRINTNGQRVWGSGNNDKLVASMADQDSSQIDVISSSQGGVIVRFIRVNGVTNASTSYFQKINRSGSLKWGEGVKFSSDVLIWNNQIAMNAGKNKSVVILSDRTINNEHVGLYAYKLDRNGNILGD